MPLNQHVYDEQHKLSIGLEDDNWEKDMNLILAQMDCCLFIN